MNSEIITVTEDRRIVCSKCGLEYITIEELRDNAREHYYREHEWNRNCLCPEECPDHIQLRDNNKVL